MDSRRRSQSFSGVLGDFRGIENWGNKGIFLLCDDLVMIVVKTKHGGSFLAPGP